MACLILYRDVPGCVKRISKCLSIDLYTVMVAAFQRSCHKEITGAKSFFARKKEFSNRISSRILQMNKYRVLNEFFPFFEIPFLF